MKERTKRRIAAAVEGYGLTGPKLAAILGVSGPTAKARTYPAG